MVGVHSGGWCRSVFLVIYYHWRIFTQGFDFVRECSENMAPHSGTSCRSETPGGGVVQDDENGERNQTAV